MFPVIQSRRIICYMYIFVVAFTVSTLTVFNFQCTPIHAFWDTLAGKFPVIPGMQCINVKAYLVGTCVANAITILALVISTSLAWVFL